MANEVDKDSLKQLKKIEKELVQIKDRTLDPRRAFLFGIFYGAGGFVGGVIAVALFGWLLSFLGFIPGLGELTTYLSDVTSAFKGR